MAVQAFQTALLRTIWWDHGRSNSSSTFEDIILHKNPIRICIFFVFMTFTAKSLNRISPPVGSDLTILLPKRKNFKIFKIPTDLFKEVNILFRPFLQLDPEHQIFPQKSKTMDYPKSSFRPA